MFDLITSAGALGGMIAPVLIGYFGYGINLKFHKINIRLDTQERQISKVLNKDSAKEKILECAKIVDEIIRVDDMPIMLFITSCIDVSQMFYEKITSGNIRLKTKRDIEKYSNNAISIVLRGCETFEHEFVDMFWPEFERKAIEVREDFIKIIDDSANNKDSRILTVIQKYLSDQLITICQQRNEFLNR